MRRVRTGHEQAIAFRGAREDIPGAFVLVRRRHAAEFADPAKDPALSAHVGDQRAHGRSTFGRPDERKRRRNDGQRHSSPSERRPERPPHARSAQRRPKAPCQQPCAQHRGERADVGNRGLRRRPQQIEVHHDREHHGCRHLLRLVRHRPGAQAGGARSRPVRVARQDEQRHPRQQNREVVEPRERILFVEQHRAWFDVEAGNGTDGSLVLGAAAFEHVAPVAEPGALELDEDEKREQQRGGCPSVYQDLPRDNPPAVRPMRHDQHGRHGDADTASVVMTKQEDDGGAGGGPQEHPRAPVVGVPPDRRERQRVEKDLGIAVEARDEHDRAGGGQQGEQPRARRPPREHEHQAVAERQEDDVEQHLAQQASPQQHLGAGRRVGEEKLSGIDEVPHRQVAQHDLLRERQVQVVVVDDRGGGEPEEECRRGDGDERRKPAHARRSYSVVSFP